jgi:hypothetical protein
MAKPTEAEAGYDVVWPLGRSTVEHVVAEHRLPDPTGKTIGLVWDHVFRGDEIFRVVQDALGQSHPDLRFVDHAAFGDIHGQDDQAVLAALPDRLRAEGVDAVIVAVAA